MTQSYYILQQNIQTEHLIQKSRFICSAQHVHTEEEAINSLQKIQKAHRDATHHCYAYRITEHIQKSSDDGEPTGTAGRPILNALTQNQLHSTLIVVTRYFGGIKLGGGGLIRAYSESASASISKAGVVKMALYQHIEITFDYTHLSQLEYKLRHQGYPLESIQYGASIVATVWVPLEKVQNFQKEIASWTQGSATFSLNETAYRPSDILKKT